MSAISEAYAGGTLALADVPVDVWDTTTCRICGTGHHVDDPCPTCTADFVRHHLAVQEPRP